MSLLAWWHCINHFIFQDKFRTVYLEKFPLGKEEWNYRYFKKKKTTNHSIQRGDKQRFSGRNLYRAVCFVGLLLHEVFFFF